MQKTNTNRNRPLQKTRGEGRKMIALDLFCGAGGASKGLLDAEFEEITGIDINEQLEYPKTNDGKVCFVKTDVFNLKLEMFKAYDFIWASPPCQAYSIGTKLVRNKGRKYPDLISKTRKLLLKTGKPFVIENVQGSPIRKDLILCGEMFDLPIIRHRCFEIYGFECKKLKHKKHSGRVWNGKKKGWGKNKKFKKYFSVTGHCSGTLKQWQKAMEITWIKNRHTLTQCVPPKYAEYIGKQFLEAKK